MAITDINEYAHLTEADVEALGAELDALRREIESDRGVRDARYLRRTIAAQRILEAGGRLTLLGSRNRGFWLAGTAMLSVAKIIENMELGHNVMHGQWDWMNDPEIHSTSWEWDMVCASEHWKHSHNYIHHKYTNVLNMDHDVGYRLLRVTRDEPWQWKHLPQPLANLFLAATFEWGIGLHDLEIKEYLAGNKPKEIAVPQIKAFGRKVARQLAKDFVIFPLLSGKAARSTLTANLTANVIRNFWAYVVIFCGHFPDGAEKFTEETLVDETHGQWYLRQMLGTANFKAGPAMAFMSGNLCYQIEHHLYPDLPSNRYAEIGVRIRELCEKYDLPYTTGSLSRQYWQTFRTISKLSLPDRFLTATSDDAPETASEKKFSGLRAAAAVRGKQLAAAGEEKRVGLKTAIAEVAARRKAVHAS
ncbi:MAG: acyl-CoA desaturase [Gordonia sp.]|uniref:Acyl-CoA desaturase n=1 Tax=Gordonia rubripertincta TaxID=36822 RepID=A0ABT4N698_GORRU|nr:MULTISPECIES: acyl-CoA desaturase [Mycobacteriales]MBA4025403.1 acyl-CoA desaturase [Gordonia sp. (in: high G+C Gram-positive bacteria)]MCZ4553891.1 acyl-CoA desaturase [Gordonia rubripertincta]OZG30523.1 acyl-CoA desaturase [Williamsia sp. 1138]